MKYLGRSFSVPMPGASVKWPFPQRRDGETISNVRHPNCPHPAVRRTLVAGVFMCRDCKDQHDGKMIVSPERDVDLCPFEEWRR